MLLSRAPAVLLTEDGRRPQICVAPSVRLDMKRTPRIASYQGWTIDAAPVILAQHRLFQSCAVIRRDNGERFVFVDLGNRVYRWQAHDRGIEWAKHWIDNNYTYRAARRSE